MGFVRIQDLLARRLEDSEAKIGLVRIRFRGIDLSTASAAKHILKYIPNNPGRASDALPGCNDSHRYDPCIILYHIMYRICVLYFIHYIFITIIYNMYKKTHHNI